MVVQGAEHEPRVPWGETVPAVSDGRLCAVALATRQILAGASGRQFLESHSEGQERSKCS